MMPSKSAKQRRFMAAAAHNSKFAKKAGIKQSVAKEFNRADQSVVTKAMGGAIRSVVSRAAGKPQVGYAPKGGALGRAVASIAAQSQKRPQPQPVKSNHLFRNAGPIKPSGNQALLSGSDQTISETGNGLRGIMGKIASSTRNRVAAAKGGKIQKGYKEGGKVGTAMSALQQLAKKYREALDMDDTDTATRIARQMERIEPGSSKKVSDPGEKASQEKVETFSGGGKVKRIAKMIRARMDDREGYIREGLGATREEAHANLRKEVAHDNGEDVVDALLKEHGVTYKRSKE